MEEEVVGVRGKEKKLQDKKIQGGERVRSVGVILGFLPRWNLEGCTDVRMTPKRCRVHCLCVLLRLVVPVMASPQSGCVRICCLLSCFLHRENQRARAE